MISTVKRPLIVVSLLSATMLAGCVSQSKYDALQTQYQQLQQQSQEQSQELAAAKAQVSRLQTAIKYTVNSDLLFPSGGWELSARGKRLIAQLSAKLAPTQQNKIVVNGYTDNAPIGPALQRQGVTSNQVLSQKRAESVMQFLISQGFKADLLSAHGYGDANPVASNDTAQGRAKNRRVELAVVNSAS